MDKLVGLYVGSEEVAKDPTYLDVLKDEIGLNLIILFGAYDLSPETRAKNPATLGGTQTHAMNLTDDDSAMRRAIEVAHERDLQVWFCVSCWWSGVELPPEVMMQDLNGRPISESPSTAYSHEGRTHTYCPNHPAVDDWFSSAYTELVRSYEIDGLDLTHARYCHPAYYPGLFGCGCDYCAQTAQALGYDFSRMRAACLRALDRLKRTDATEILRFSELGLSFIGMLQHLSEDSAVADWFDFRCDNLCGRIRTFRRTVENAVDRKVTFGSDTFVPTFAALVGHRYSEFATCSSYTSPLLPHFEIHILMNLVSLASMLRQKVGNLSEPEALRAVQRLFRYDDFDLPDTIEGFGIGAPDCETRHASLYNIIESELRKARLYNRGEVPSYPVIKGDLWPTEVVKGLIEAAERMGHEGIIFQGTSSLVEYPKS